eukprot:gnl/Spiro4/23563_TR11642_c0_g1_i1.p1 gnl/Spiro4/23563_TR11642_c0_g1~~gnl/Spiro4/23563_TR11642_c0_g1_i1.p1  ORF type:complete len:670 (-),score=217.60 gnl/Spiro4/23563_TR11642_c0_g1_i1:54-2063(-)
MPVFAIIDFAIGLWNFRNIDLVQQGLYHLRCRLQTKQGHMVVIPTSHSNVLPTGIPSEYLPANIADDYSFHSRTFYIRYEEESVQVGDVCQFQLELDAERELHDSVLMELELLHASRHSEGHLSDFSAIAKRTLMFNDLDKGLHEAFPVIFDDVNFAVLDLVVHSTLLDFRFKTTGGLMRADPSDSKDRRRDEKRDRKLAGQPDSALKFLVDNRALLVDRLASTYHRLVRKMTRLCRHSAQLSTNPVPTPPLEIPPPPAPDCADPPHILTLKDTNVLAGQIMVLWGSFMDRVIPCLGDFFPHLHEAWHRRTLARWNESTFRETITLEDLSLPMYLSTQDMHMGVGEKLRASQHYRAMRPLNVEDMMFSTTSEHHPIFFEQTITTRDETAVFNPRTRMSGQGDFTGRHLFVLVHGFQGNSYDLRLMKNFILTINPDGVFLCSRANELDTVRQDLQSMGEKLAKEIDRFVTRENITVSKLSFIAHSMGSIITRACLTTPLMQRFLPRLHTFVSLSSPHLGYMYSKNKLLDSAMWIYKMYRRSSCLKQLSLSDGKELENCYLYQLSQARVLEYFSHILLVSSPQDRYVPIHSARIESCADAPKDGKKGRVFMQMVDNLLSPLKGHHVLRVNVMFSIQGGLLQNAIGRTAHILFLDSSFFFRMFVYSYRRYFL